MRSYTSAIVFTLIILLIDFYAYKGIHKFTTNLKHIWRNSLRIIYWSIPVVVFSSMIIFTIIRRGGPSVNYLNIFHFFMGFFVMFYLPKLIFIIFQLVEDMIHLIAKATTKLAPQESAAASTANKINRSQFLSRMGIIVAAVPLVAVANGIWRGRFDYVVRRHELIAPNLPSAFDGKKVIHISDLHIGSFAGHPERIVEAVELINRQEGDVVLFSGDMVNNQAKELDKFISILKDIDARYGKFSVLGNHDYGDYVRWENAQQKQDNLKQLIENNSKIGFNLLNNDSQAIDINGQQIGIIGVENWGMPPFPRHGDLNRAMQNTKDTPFKILMTHDPFHFSEEVEQKTDIDLTLSGHTHGLQFGIEIPGWRWSPANIRYKHWGGFYKEGEQYISVNTGIGFIAFPGRVGMPPEITVIELKKAPVA